MHPFSCTSSSLVLRLHCSCALRFSSPVRRGIQEVASLLLRPYPSCELTFLPKARPTKRGFPSRSFVHNFGGIPIPQQHHRISYATQVLVPPSALTKPPRGRRCSSTDQPVAGDTASKSSAAAMADVGKSGAKGNRLAKEQSPYLLQHAFNPVDWYPWGEEAFLKAKQESKLIFLSVGYSTCHWCHVMEEESFENEEVAALLNEGFVSIKVDREERPDVDKVYMTYVQATQGGGGWPMSVFLTPSLTPVLGGTYFPPEDKLGRVGFKTLLRRVRDLWQRKQTEVEKAGEGVMRQLEEAMEPSVEPSAGSSGGTQGLASQALDKCFGQLSSRFDKNLGGFGPPPKFPRPSELNALLRQHHWLRSQGQSQPQSAQKGKTETMSGATGAEVGSKEHPSDGDSDRAEESGGVRAEGDAAGQALEMVLFTLQRMAQGGIHDHVGGGFHRYSVDEYWHVPHFEKMLYDQAQLVGSCLCASASAPEQAQAQPLAVLARDILDYVLRDLTHPEGGFFSAQDADSQEGEEKKEGAFYVWSQQEIEEVLGPSSEESRLFCRHYSVLPSGNCTLSPRSDPLKEFVGKNCLIQREPLRKTAQEMGVGEERAEIMLAESREALHRRRGTRPRPHLDDKVIVAWNGLMISAFARASRMLRTEAAKTSPPTFHFPVTGCSPEAYLTAATRAASFIRDNLYDPNSKTLRRCFRGSASATFGFADDYAFLISALLDLFEGTGGELQWLEWALDLQHTQDSLFWDSQTGGYFSTAQGDASILLRLKEDYDGAEPSANSYSLANLARLGRIVGDERAKVFREKSEKVAAAFLDRLSTVPLAMPQMCAFLPLLGFEVEPRQVIIAGDIRDDTTDRLLTAALCSVSADSIVIPLNPSNEEHARFWSATNPSVWKMVTGKRSGPGPAAFVCQDFTCLPPTPDPETLSRILSKIAGPGKVEPQETRL